MHVFFPFTVKLNISAMTVKFIKYYHCANDLPRFESHAFIGGWKYRRMSGAEKSSYVKKETSWIYFIRPRSNRHSRRGRYRDRQNAHVIQHAVLEAHNTPPHLTYILPLRVDFLYCIAASTNDAVEETEI